MSSLKIHTLFIQMPSIKTLQVSLEDQITPRLPCLLPLKLPLNQQLPPSILDRLLSLLLRILNVLSQDVLRVEEEDNRLEFPQSTYLADHHLDQLEEELVDMRTTLGQMSWKASMIPSLVLYFYLKSLPPTGKLSHALHRSSGRKL
jgi:hypothetical protein